MSFRNLYHQKNFENEEDNLIEPIVKNMEMICNNMLNNNEHGKIRDEYNGNLVKLKLYMHSFIKTLNKCNTGTLCNICMNNMVDTYINPCGHTGCSECLDKLNEYDMKCFVCRKGVLDIKNYILRKFIIYIFIFIKRKRININHSLRFFFN